MKPCEKEYLKVGIFQKKIVTLQIEIQYFIIHYLIKVKEYDLF